jgi:hypothetical protein
MSALSILSGEAHWRARSVRYYAGDWNSILSVLPAFDLVPFAAGQDEPANPFLQTVMRRPLSATERPIPVGVVSHTYSLASHRDVAALCRKEIVGRGIDLFESGIDAGELRYEVGLSELGEWMNFRSISRSNTASPMLTVKRSTSDSNVSTRSTAHPVL